MLSRSLSLITSHTDDRKTSIAAPDAMKLFIKLMILALILSYASLFIIKRPDGTPIRTLDSLIPSAEFDFSGITGLLESGRAMIESLGEDRPRDLPDETQTESGGLYRWRDENGTLNYSNSPPPGVRAERITPEAPTVMTLYPETGSEEAAAQASEEPPSDSGGQLPGRLGEMQETLQQAQEVSDQFQRKLEEQQEVLESL